MTAADRVIQIAEAQVGTIEAPINRTKYGAWYGMDGQPWCAIFLSWIFDQAGCLDAIGGKQHQVVAALDWAKRSGRVVAEPRPGDLVVFRFRTGWHIGLVEDATPGLDLQTIEGNTSSGAAGSQRDGGGVYRRVRRRSSAHAYIRPIYPSEEAVTDEDIERIARRVAELLGPQFSELPFRVWMHRFWSLRKYGPRGERVETSMAAALLEMDRRLHQGVSEDGNQ